MGARARYPVEEALGHRIALIVEGVRLVDGPSGPIAVVHRIIVVRVITTLRKVDVGVREGGSG
jgi:hypothetical protein